MANRAATDSVKASSALIFAALTAAMLVKGADGKTDAGETTRAFKHALRKKLIESGEISGRASAPTVDLSNVAKATYHAFISTQREGKADLSTLINATTVALCGSDFGAYEKAKKAVRDALSHTASVLKVEKVEKGIGASSVVLKDPSNAPAPVEYLSWAAMNAPKPAAPAPAPAAEPTPAPESTGTKKSAKKK